MNGPMFIETWLMDKMLPALKKADLEAIFVLDNASYHLIPFPGAINISDYTTKAEILKIFEQYAIPYRAGKALG